MHRLFIPLCLLLLTGCAQKPYAERLNLKAPAVPPILAPITVDRYDYTPLIQSATTQTQLDNAFNQVKGGISIIKVKNPPTSQVMSAKWKVVFPLQGEAQECARQATIIKGAQLEAGDTTDSTGEVAALLQRARQYKTNAIFLMETPPVKSTPTPTLPPAPQ